MTVREFMKDANSGTFIIIRVPTFKEDGSFLRYEGFRTCPVEWPNIKGIDETIFDRKIEHWFVRSNSFVDSNPTIIFDTTKGD